MTGPPWFGLEFAIAEHLAIGMAFVAVSLARSYLLRRLFALIYRFSSLF